MTEMTKMEDWGDREVFEAVQSGEMPFAEFSDWVSSRHDRAYSSGQDNMQESMS